MPAIQGCPKHKVNFYTRCPVCKKEGREEEQLVNEMAPRHENNEPHFGPETDPDEDHLF